MNFNKYKNQIEAIMSKDYDHEIPDKPRSADFNKIIKSMMKNAFPDCEVFPTRGTWCQASGFIKNESGHYIYYSFDDYRYWQWDAKILYRTAKNEKDYTGGPNHYAYGLEEMKERIDFEFSRMG